MKIQYLTSNGGRIKLSNLVIIVGPNNSGKSSFLADTYDQFTQIHAVGRNKWPSILDPDSSLILLKDYKEWKKNIWKLDDTPFAEGEDAYGYKYNFSSRQQTAIQRAKFITLNTILENNEPAANKVLNLNNALASPIKGSLSAHLSTLDRLQFANNFTGNFISPRIINQQITSFLFNNPHILRSINSLLAEFYSKQLFVLGHLHPSYEVMVGNKDTRLPPTPKLDPEGINNASNIYLKWKKKYSLNAPNEEGDGLRALLHLTFALGNPYLKVLFIDEPEAHLYPRAKRTLGKIIAEDSKRKQIFVVTHDSDIFESLISNSEEFNVIRINQDHELKFATFNRNSIKRIGSERKESNAAEPAFYDTAVFVEGPNDSYFYSRIYEKLKVNEFSTYFVDCFGADRVKHHLGIAIELGVPFCVILDFDTLINESTRKSSTSHAFNTLKKMAKAKKIPRSQVLKIDGLINTNQNKIKELNTKYRNLDPKVGKRHQTAEIKEIRSLLGNWGVFIVPTGELKSWFTLKGKPVEYQVRDFDQKSTDNKYQSLRGFSLRIERYLQHLL